MRQLDVDIAVDLSGHTQGQRSAIFAQRAAAVQVNYLGLPATMGADYMDYLIADRYLVPDSQRPHYAEQVVWLPGCFQPNDDRRALRPCSRGRSAHGLPAQGIVFCCFNAGSKLNPGVFDAWCRLLRQAPASTLWLFAADPGAQRNLRREAAQRGLDPQRLVFANPLGYEDHLARYSHADLFLDTLPFNGGATASDALSMGVPVLTLSGSGFASRMAGSLLSHLGLAELVARSWDDYVAIGAALAADPQRLAGMREYLLRARTQHDFFNTDRYRVGLEAAYEAMWERRLRGLPPAALEF
jgi:predicted O-linked N-acetylglucosamine transferase (SPINDLY family)